ncbi:MAG: ArnT family glycosyltransferase [Thermodesulfobacteriota bacterium]
MELFLLILSMALPVAGGTFFIRWLLRADAELSIFEAVTFGIGAGLGFTAFEMLLLGLLGLPFTVVTAGLPVAVFTALFFFLARTGLKARGLAMPGTKGQGLHGLRLYLTIIMVLWVAAKTGFVFYESLTRPVFSYDSFLNWAIAGKFFYYKAGLFLDASNEHFLGRGYRYFIGHPLHLSLLQTWIALVLGLFHEVYVKAPGPLYFAGVLGLLYYGVKREAGSYYALITVFFMAGVPIFTVHGQDAYADLPLCFFALSGTVALWRFFKDDLLSYLVLGGIFLAMAMFVKNEGIFFALAGGAALVLYLFTRKRSFIAPLAGFILPFIIIAGPWMLFKYHHGIGSGHSGPSSGFQWFSSNPLDPDAVSSGMHWEVLGIAFREIFFTANYNLIFPLWIIASLIALRTIISSRLKYLYVIILLVSSMFLFIYLTLEITAVTEETGIHRNTLTYLPLVYFAAALVISNIWPDSRRAATRGESPSSSPASLTGQVSDDIL